ncbi:MAG: hypothetical protein WBZ36_23385 [Candidatus Nitrosopolaris sp.]
MSAYSGGMAVGAVLGPVVAANSGWQGNFYFIDFSARRPPVLTGGGIAGQ